MQLDEIDGWAVCSDYSEYGDFVDESCLAAKQTLNDTEGGTEPTTQITAAEYNAIVQGFVGNAAPQTQGTGPVAPTPVVVAAEKVNGPW